MVNVELLGFLLPLFMVVWIVNAERMHSSQTSKYENSYIDFVTFFV